ncbi:hypothetical protein T4B_14423, partial [Trichinella pseudospiralis]
LVWFILMDFLFCVTIKVIFNTIMSLLCRMNIYCNTNLVENEVDVWKFQSMTMAENDPHVIGKASHKTCLNITDVISALSTKCILIADSFIKRFESRQRDISQFLKIKVEAVLSKSIEGCYLQKQF